MNHVVLFLPRKEVRRSMTRSEALLWGSSCLSRGCIVWYVSSPPTIKYLMACIPTLRLQIPAVSFKYLSPAFGELANRYSYRCNSAYMFLSWFTIAGMEN